MVLLRTLLSAPTLTLSPTRQFLLSRWRTATLHYYGPFRSKINVAAVLAAEFKWVPDGKKRLPKEYGHQQSLAVANWSLERCPQRFPTRSKGGEGSAQTRVQCLSTAASSKGLSIRFPVTLEENATIDSNAQAAIDQIKMDGPVVLSMVAKEFEDIESTETVELSLLLCNDAFIQDLNSKWLGKDSPTDVLSFPQDQEPGLTPHLLLGDIIISLDTAARQAAERGHTLLDELRILLVHGLLHVLGYDHELGPEYSQEMEEKETQILNELGWKGQGLITAATHESSPEDVAQSVIVNEPVRKPPPKRTFKILFCDMDGTLLNPQSRVTEATADALRAVMAKGVQVVIATGKTQYGAMAALRPMGLTGEGGIISTTSPGVFTQGLQVYGKGGSVIYSAVLDPAIVKEAFDYSMEQNLPTAFDYSLEKNIPSIGFSGNRIVALFENQLTEVLHTHFLEPKAEVVPSIDDLIASCPVQKLLFYDTPEAIKYKVRPYWAAKYEGQITLVQALDDMLELLPPGQSKGAGVKMLLDHFGVSPNEVMAIGDGENDIEMLKLAGWGVAMANGSPLTKAAANALTGSNTEDGAAQAIHRYILS
ncbi:unnamed protein product [Calypogeia fissa]